uniref:Uncharacterized protein n=1 Tax=Arundo donax TaxID=35708 RepID=A0A0A8ZEE8_ARUDO
MTYFSLAKRESYLSECKTAAPLLCPQCH